MSSRVSIRGFVRQHVASVRTVMTVAFVTVGLIAGSAFSIIRTDPTEFPTLFDGLWWAITTITTVGYGDIVPESSEGRIIGIVLMFSGVGLLAILTASIAALLMSEDVEAEEQRIEARLDAIEAQLQDIATAICDAPGNTAHTTPKGSNS